MSNSDLSDIFKDAYFKPESEQHQSSTPQEEEIKDIIGFFDDVEELDLTPQQIFIYKCIYGLPLDDNDRVIPIYDKFKENIEEVLTEVEFFYWLRERGWINQATPEGILAKKFIEIILPMGRRSSKSFMIGGIFAFLKKQKKSKRI